jgi:hypothetical protein
MNEELNQQECDNLTGILWFLRLNDIKMVALKNPIDEHMLQIGWNHQADTYYIFVLNTEYIYNT